MIGKYNYTLVVSSTLFHFSVFLFILWVSSSITLSQDSWSPPSSRAEKACYIQCSYKVMIFSIVYLIQHMHSYNYCYCMQVSVQILVKEFTQVSLNSTLLMKSFTFCLMWDTFLYMLVNVSQLAASTKQLLTPSAFY